jgi:CspA family cold shock protein
MTGLFFVPDAIFPTMSQPLLLELPSDRFLTCARCHITFVWTGWEQVQDARQPRHCPGCRYLLTHTRRWGVVKWFDPRRGFGFITTAEGEEVYVRRRDVVRGRLRRGQLVSFRLKEGRQGVRAVRVRAHGRA